jgi:calcium-dependent protein kinase
MGNYGCCQSSIIPDEPKNDPIQESKKIEMTANTLQEEPKLLENNHLHKHKRKTKKTIHQEHLVNKKHETESFKFNKADFVHLTLGSVEASYIIVSPLGKGSFGCVYEAKHKLSNSYRAVKVLKKENMTEKTRIKLLQEVEILKSLDHPNILKVFEVIEDSQSINIITELCTGGELFDRIVSSGKLTENKAASYMHQIMSAVLTCHDKDIVHRDLKPENILFTSKSEDSPLRVIDFGTSRKIDHDTTLTSLTGTVSFI